MALGAAPRQVAGLVLSQSLRPVAAGLVAGGGLAAAVSMVMMATPAASDVGGWVNVFDLVPYAESARLSPPRVCWLWPSPLSAPPVSIRLRRSDESEHPSFRLAGACRAISRSPQAKERAAAA